MRINSEDTDLLKELCKKHSLSFDKIQKLIDITKEFEMRDSRNGIYSALKEVIKNKNI